jgi:hypothetical protein
MDGAFYHCASSIAESGTKVKNKFVPSPHPSCIL